MTLMFDHLLARHHAWLAHQPGQIVFILRSLEGAAWWLAISALIFLPLAWLFAHRREQPIFRRDMLTDLTYWMAGPLFYGPIYFMLVVFLLSAVYPPEAIKRLNSAGLRPIADLPVWLQACLALLVTDIIQYWMHRLFHSERLWPFHAVHHSSVHLDWMSAARFHPVNILLYSTLVGALVFLIGFSPAAFALLRPFNMLYSPLVHANLAWSYGPFKYLLASPAFHRWHHTSADLGGRKNFAPTFPFLDLLFGTFYMPKGAAPERFGADGDAVPQDFFGQLAHPFRRRPKTLASSLLSHEEASASAPGP
jgi:sterol desaturase/sphingolipid hydroxylase (fatty acid hydroxylase superfamily)